MGLVLSRPCGTRDLLASDPALKRWAILACPFGTARQRPSRAGKTAPVFSSKTRGTRSGCAGERVFATPRSPSYGFLARSKRLDSRLHSDADEPTQAV